MKALNIFIVVAFLSFGLPQFGEAQAGMEITPVLVTGDLRGELQYIHHETQVLVINDNAYSMPLNLKVLDGRGKKVNRFALKEGQALMFFASYSRADNRLLVESIQILE